MRTGTLLMAWLMVFVMIPVGLTAQRGRLTATQILDRAAQAEAPPSARARIKSLRIKGQVSVPAQGLNGSIEIYWKSPNRLLVVQNLSGVGEVRQGFDGKVGWEKSPLTGLRRLQGAELEQFKYTSDNTAAVRWRQFVRSPKLKGTQKVGNTQTYVVQATTTYGASITFYIDTKQFLTRRVDTEVAVQGGKLPVSLFFEDYRRVDGIHYPFRTRQQMAGLEMIMQFQQVSHNVPLPDSIFAMPKE